MDTKHLDIVPVSGLRLQAGLLLAVLDDARQEWRYELGEVSPDAIQWQANHNGHSIGAILLHIANIEAFWLYEVAAGKARSSDELETLLANETNQYKQIWPIPPAQPLSWYYAQQDAIRERTKRTVAELDRADFVAIWNGETFTLRWLINHVISHEAYHGGQAVLLSLQQKFQNENSK